MTYETASDRVVANIRKYRGKRGWSMAELAARCGLSENVIANIESGRRDSSGRRRRHVTAEEMDAIEMAFWGRPATGGLLQDPDWEEKNLEENRQHRAQQARMMEDPDLAAAYLDILSATDVVAAAQERYAAEVRRWHEANGA